MEALTQPQARVSDKDVTRVRKAITGRKKRAEVFPALDGLGTAVDGEGLQVKVRIVKDPSAAPVRYAIDGPAAAIREVDLQLKYHKLPNRPGSAAPSDRAPRESSPRPSGHR